MCSSQKPGKEDAQSPLREETSQSHITNGSGAGPGFPTGTVGLIFCSTHFTEHSSGAWVEIHQRSVNEGYIKIGKGWERVEGYLSTTSSVILLWYLNKDRESSGRGRETRWARQKEQERDSQLWASKQTSIPNQSPLTLAINCFLCTLQQLLEEQSWYNLTLFNKC